MHSTPGSAPPFSAAVCHWLRWRLSLCVWPESVMSLPPRPGEALSQCGSCGSSQTRQSSSYLQGCGVTASFMRWHCLVLVDLTSLSPPSVFKGIWPSPSREEAGICRMASCCLSCIRSQDHLPSLPSYPCGKGLFCAQPPVVGFQVAWDQDVAICQVICPDKHLLFTRTCFSCSGWSHWWDLLVSWDFKPVCGADVQTQNFWSLRGSQWPATSNLA